MERWNELHPHREHRNWEAINRRLLIGAYENERNSESARGSRSSPADSPCVDGYNTNVCANKTGTQKWAVALISASLVSPLGMSPLDATPTRSLLTPKPRE